MEDKENKGGKLLYKKLSKKVGGLQRSSPVDVYVGSRLRFKRMEVKLSQNALASKLGLTFQQVQKYEKGVNRIGSGRLYELSKILGVSISYFFENYELEDNVVKAMNGSVSGVNLTNDDIELERDVKNLIKNFCMIKSKVLRKSVIGLAKSLNVDGEV